MPVSARPAQDPPRARRLHDDHDGDRPLAGRAARRGRGHRGQRRLPDHRRDFTRKQAYEAAKAGINEYAFHLHKDTAYWTKCTERRQRRTAVNQLGSTANRRAVPGSDRRRLRDRTDPGRPDTPAATAPTSNRDREHARALGPMKGTFRDPLDRLRRQGAGLDHRDLQAGQLPRLRLLHPAGDLRPGHLRRRRNDQRRPNEQCSKTIAEGRYERSYDPELGGLNKIRAT